MASRLARVADVGRRVEQRLGLRPYRCFLVWARWSGAERGEGERTIACRHEVLPSPVVDGVGGLQRAKGGAGFFDLGQVRVSQVSSRYTHDALSGTSIPDRDELDVPAPYDFYWEIVEDGRHGPAPVRRKFALASEPSFSAEDGCWTVQLERQADDPNRDGDPVDEPRSRPPLPPMRAIPPDRDDP